MDKEKNIVELLQEETQKGNVVISTFEGLMAAPFEEIINQPAEGILYDLNNDAATCFSWLGQKDYENRWINDYAAGQIIVRLKEKLAELARLQRIEAAARALVEEWYDDATREEYLENAPDIVSLFDALEE